MQGNDVQPAKTSLLLLLVRRASVRTMRDQSIGSMLANGSLHGITQLGLRVRKQQTYEWVRNKVLVIEQGNQSTVSFRSSREHLSIRSETVEIESHKTFCLFLAVNFSFFSA